MDPVLIFIKAAITGFLVAVPIGAIGAICIRRSLQGLWLDGLLIGLGAALADTVLGAAGFYGLALLIGLLEGHERLFMAVGGLVMLLFAIRMIRASGPTDRALGKLSDALNHVSFLTLLRDFATGFSLTIINPAPIIAFAAIFAGLGIFDGAADAKEGGTGAVLVFGLFAGGAAWWVLLTFGTLALRRKISDGFIRRINQGLGLTVMIFGLLALSEGLFGLDL